MRDLLDTLKRETLVLDWRKKQQALDAGLPASYTPTLYQRKCEEVFQHVFDSYTDARRSIYTAALLIPPKYPN